jgi:hypothetical protein
MLLRAEIDRQDAYTRELQLLHEQQYKAHRSRKPKISFTRAYGALLNRYIDRMIDVQKSKTAAVAQPVLQAKESSHPSPALNTSPVLSHPSPVLKSPTPSPSPALSSNVQPAQKDEVQECTTSFEKLGLELHPDNKVQPPDPNWCSDKLKATTKYDPTQEDMAACNLLHSLRGNLNSCGNWQPNLKVRGISVDLKFTHKQIKTICQHFPNVTYFCCKSLDDKAVKELAAFKNLTHLIITDCKGSYITPKGLKAIAHLPLVFLHVSHCQNVSDILSQFKTLEVAIIGDPRITSDLQKYIVDTHPSLEILMLTKQVKQ